MNIKIIINCDNDAVYTNLEEGLSRILHTIPKKIREQLQRDGCCICTTSELTNKLIDINGNTVGVIKIYYSNQWEDQELRDESDLENDIKKLKNQLKKEVKEAYARGFDNAIARCE